MSLIVGQPRGNFLDSEVSGYSAEEGIPAGKTMGYGKARANERDDSLLGDHGNEIIWNPVVSHPR